MVIAECPICEKLIAEIRSLNTLGEVVINTRRIGVAAELLFDRYNLVAFNHNYKIYSGTKSREYEFINKFGIIYNGNNIKVAEQDEFLQMSRKEVTNVLNERFFKTNKIKLGI